MVGAIFKFGCALAVVGMSVYAAVTALGFAQEAVGDAGEALNVTPASRAAA
jgi:hypothetical protein